jgi:hypothetical protein
MKLEIDVQPRGKGIVTITTERGPVKTFADMSNIREVTTDIMRRRLIAELSSVLAALAAIDGGG